MTAEDAMKGLIAFFYCKLAADPSEVREWIIKNGDDPDDFIDAVGKADLRLTLRKATVDLQ